MEEVMSKKSLMMVFMLVLTAALAFSSVFSAPVAAKNLPKVVGVTSYGVRSAGYAAAMAIGDAVKKHAGISFRVLPGASNMARILPIVTGRAKLGLAGTAGAFCAAFGVYPFHAPEMGPQPMRVIWSGPLPTGFAVYEDSGMKNIADLKGKRVAKIPGAVALDMQSYAMLLHGGLTWDDVKPVVCSGYVAAMKALLEGTVDTAMMMRTASIAYEIESKRGGVRHLSPSKDPEVIKKGLSIAPWTTPGWIKYGAGIEYDKPETWEYSFVWPYPFVSTADRDPELMYAITKGIAEGYKDFSKTTAEMKHWDLEYTLDYKLLVYPYHDGAVRYFKEIGAWTPEMEKWQKKMEGIEVARIALWQEGLAAAKKAGIDVTKPEWHSPLEGFWRQYLIDHDLWTIPDVAK
jgi:TRAP transporter TAXI family solute receptor